MPRGPARRPAPSSPWVCPTTQAGTSRAYSRASSSWPTGSAAGPAARALTSSSGTSSTCSPTKRESCVSSPASNDPGRPAKLGVGLIYSPALQDFLERRPDAVDVVPQTYWLADDPIEGPFRPLEEVERL